MAQLKFYRKAQAPASPAQGAIWFNTTDKTIQIYTGTAWEKYAGNLNDATWSGSTLTITKHDGSSIALDFSDMASASAMSVELGKKLNIGTTSDGSTATSYYGLKKYTDEQVAAKNVSATSNSTEYITASATNNTVTIAATAKLTEAVAKVDAFFEGADISETANAYKDTLKELQTYITEDASAATAMTNSIAEIKKAAVNGQGIVNAQGNGQAIVLDGADIKITGYEKGTAADLTETDTINTALGKLEARVDAAAAGGVQTVNGLSGAVEISCGSTNGTIKISAGTGMLTEEVTIAGLKSAAYTESSAYATAEQGAKADSALQNVTSANTSAIAITTGTNTRVINVILATLSALQNGTYTNKNGVGTPLITADVVYDFVNDSISNATAWVEFD